MRTYLALFIISACGALLTTPLVLLLARRLRAFGPEEEGREQSVIPRLGGLAIYFSSIISWIPLLFLRNDVAKAFHSDWQIVLLLLLPSTIIILVGLWDDFTGLSAKEKFALQITVAGIAWWAGFRIQYLPFLGYVIRHPLASFLLTVLWIVAVTNSLNLIDGLDGLATGVAFLTTLCLFIVSVINNIPLAAVVAISLAGSLAGFLKFNFAPARIYLGDGGSLFLGFVLSVLAVHTGQKTSTLVSIVVPYMALGLPLLDTSLTLFRRLLSGQPIFKPDRDHIHHRLLAKSGTPQMAVLMLYAVTALFGFGSLFIVHSTGNVAALIALLIGIMGWFLVKFVDYAEIQELESRISQGLFSQRRIMSNQISIRKASRQVESAASLEEAWLNLTAVLETLEFDEAHCILHSFEDRAVPSEFVWKRPGFLPEDICWTVVVPIRLNGNTVGEIKIRRSMDEDTPQFQFFSILNTLLPSFEKQLQKRLTHRSAVPNT